MRLGTAVGHVFYKAEGKRGFTASVRQMKKPGSLMIERCPTQQILRGPPNYEKTQ